jgi:hypothetical protein
MSTAQRFLLEIPDGWDQVDLSGEEMARVRAQALASTDDPRVEPGPVRTPFWTAPGGFADATAAAAGTTAQEALDVVVLQSMDISSGRVTEAHEVADLTLFLASPSPPTSRERRPSSTAARPRHSDARPPARHPPPAPRGRASQDCARKGNPGGQRALSARRTRSLHAA